MPEENGNLSSDVLLVKNDVLQHKMKEANNCKVQGQNSICRAGHIYSIKAFVAFAGVVMCAQTALAIYSKSVLTSIEKRFEISSSLAGFIVGSFNIGNLLFVVVVSKLSGSGHRPRIMGGGSLLIALGGFVNFIPHLVNDPYRPSNATMHDADNFAGQSTNYPYLFLILIFGEILQGIGATVHIPLSSSYIDDYASEDNSPVYLSISFVLQNIGPGFGYLIGSWTSTIYVDFDRVPSDIIPVSSDNKAQWVGAWWLGYLIISVWVIVAALPLFFFPKAMTKRKDSNLTLSDENHQTFTEPTPEVTPQKTSLQNFDVINANSPPIDAHVVTHGEKYSCEIFTEAESEQKKLGFCQDFWLTVKKLVTNPTYMSIVFGYSGLMLVVGALTAFMPKFLEVAFRKSAGSANLTFGLAVPPTMCVGLFTGGLIVKKFQWKRSGILKFVVFAGMMSLIPIAFSTLIHCDDTSQKCETSVDVRNFSLVSSPEPEKMCGQPDCFIPSIFFVIVMSLGAMLAANMVTPIYSVVMKSVDSVDKCTAIGLLFLIIRVLGLVPAPIIAGAVIDETCIKWNVEDGKKKNCLLYNEHQFRTRYLTLIALGILICVAFNAVALFTVRRHENKGDKPRTKNPTDILRRFFTNSHRPTDESEVRPMSV